jgi:ABC-type transport system involved in multi-copper enzyme maturation permease subunit
MVVALALFSTIVTIIAAFIMGISLGVVTNFDGFRYIYYFFIQAIAYISFAFFLALLFKKTGLTIGLYFVYSLIIENILERYLNKINIGIENIGDFLPLSSSDHLLRPDLVNTALNMAQMGNTHSEYAYIISSIIYIALCCWACYYKYKKQDL